jgi:hypothetical protein
MTQGVVVAGTPIHPQQLTTTTTLTTGAIQSIDMSLFRRALFVLDLGAFGGTSPTCTAVLTIQESANGTSGWQNNATVSTLTVNTASSVGTSEIRGGQLGAGMRYVRASVVFTIGGTSPTIPVACIPLGGECDHKPGNKFNDPSVASQAVTN